MPLRTVVSFVARTVNDCVGRSADRDVLEMDDFQVRSNCFEKTSATGIACRVEPRVWRFPRIMFFLYTMHNRFANLKFMNLFTYCSLPVCECVLPKIMILKRMERRDEWGGLARSFGDNPAVENQGKFEIAWSNAFRLERKLCRLELPIFFPRSSSNWALALSRVSMNDLPRLLS
jgi:hypothetical protein